MSNCPLSGQPCPHRKTTHITELKTGGTVVELHLCHLCADKYVGETPPPPNAAKIQPPVPASSGIAHAVGALFGLLLSTAVSKNKIQVQPKINQKPPCPGCGITLEGIAHKGFIGCPQCYQHFYTELKIVIAHSHGANKHIGKVPKSWITEEIKRKETKEQTETILEQINNLKLKMAKAIEIENYEVAGVLKKKIAELQQQLPPMDIEPPTYGVEPPN